jgi:hypothetical protein
MILGLFGMSYFSAPTAPISTIHTASSMNTVAYQEVDTVIDDDDDENIVEHDVSGPKHLPYSDSRTDVEKSVSHMLHRSTNIHSPLDGNVSPVHHSNESVTDESIHRSSDNTPIGMTTSTEIQPHHHLALHDHEMITHVHVWGQYKVSNRYLGMASAAFCGLYGGSIMAPMKFSTADTKGTHYLLSFAIGAMLVNIALWIMRYLYYVLHYQSWADAYVQLPSFHLRKMWLAGGTSGILWSIGNFLSLISVFYLGEGVGYPLVQTSILISGLWGLFYFKEIQGTARIAKWLISSILTVCGILLLSFEHHAK